MNTRAYALPDPQTQPEFYADVPMKRLLAWVLDMIIIGMISVLILPLTLFTGIFFFAALFLVVSFAYRVVTLTGGSATIGMRFFGIEFRTQHGERFELGHAFLHTLGYSISLTFGILQVISVVLMLTTSRSQGLTDHVMGSVAINKAARY
ncbi:RDD family protein [Cognatishimia activa]|uniref:RDD family protein n=1 Tax=Cognatishimia activa TaxID=1715691 RepID=A0A0P1IP32_9RHOB|nr:RDD family protein [Cognatishimia activa]CUJ28365.1 RDD family protein [Cognatishimia activa]CUK25257.1 RDD family protein [Cognatishimia activa]